MLFVVKTTGTNTPIGVFLLGSDAEQFARDCPVECFVVKIENRFGAWMELVKC